MENTKDLTLVDKDLLEIDEADKDKNRFTLSKNTPVQEQLILHALQRTPDRFIRTRPGKGGGTFKYVTGAYMKKTLNYMFGWLWDSEVVRSENVIIDGVILEIVVDVKCTFKVWDEKTQTYLMITKTQAGGAEVKYKKGTKIPMDFANDRKAAITDGVKKCASELGIASDVYSEDEFRDIPADVANDVRESAKPSRKKSIKVEVDNTAKEENPVYTTEEKTITKKEMKPGAIIKGEAEPVPSEPQNEPIQEEAKKEVIDVKEEKEEPKTENKEDFKEIVKAEAKEIRESLSPAELRELNDIIMEGTDKEKSELEQAFSNPLFDKDERLNAVKKILAGEVEDAHSPIKKEEPIEIKPVKSVLDQMESGELDFDGDLGDNPKRTEAQNAKMFKCWEEYMTVKGMAHLLKLPENDENMRKAISHVIKREITSRAEITMEEAASFIEALTIGIEKIRQQNPSSK